MTDWQPMDTAPRDGTEVTLPLTFPHGVRAFWCTDLQRWVLSRPLHMESVPEPIKWRP